MRLHHRLLTLSLAAALSACSGAQGPVPSEAPAISHDTAPTPGRVVTELDPRIWRIHEARNGDLWFGSNGNGVYRYDGQRVMHYSGADGLRGLQVRDIQEDKRGHLLISTNEGVTKFDGRAFTALELVEANSSDDGWALDPEDVWIVFAPGTGGPCRYDGETLIRLELSKSPAEDAHRAKYPNTNFALDGVYTSYKDRRGHVWFGTAAVGLCRYDGKSSSWMYEEALTTTPSGGAFGIRSIYEDRAGDFWICNTRQRFRVSEEVTLDNGYSLIEYETKDGLPDAGSDADANFAYYPSMAEDEAGSMWMACGGDGVWKYDGEAVTHYPIGDGAYALQVLADREGKLWACTLEQGAFVFDDGRFAPFKP